MHILQPSQKVITQRTSMVRPVSSFRDMAQRRLPGLLFHYIDGGAYGEVTLRRNIEDMEAIELRQRVLVDVSKLDTGVTLLGRHWSMPVGLGPVGMAGMYARRGEAQAARAAADANVPFTLSTVSTCDVSEVQKVSIAPIWYQLYFLKDRPFIGELLARVKAAGVSVLVLTVDLPLSAARYRDLWSGMSTPRGVRSAAQRAWQGLTHPRWLWDVYFRGRPHAFGNIASAVEGNALGNFQTWVASNFDPSVSWRDIAWVRQHWNGKLIIKGVLDHEDARECLRHDVDGIVVSNHGGRQLDGVPSTVVALPPIVEAVSGRVPILCDGGIRSGLDVLRVMALGADACLLGRSWAYALAAQGGSGVSEMLETVRSELALAMSLTGCPDIAAASRELLVVR